MSFILRLKHWQSFLIFLFASLLSNFVLEDFDLLNLTVNTIGFILYFFWYFAVGYELSDIASIKLNKTLFTFNAFFVIASLLMIFLFFDKNYSSNSFLGFIWVTYFMYALIYLFTYPVRLIKSIELDKKARFGQYLGLLLLSIFWPIGIWWIQPKLNKINTLSQ